MKYLAPTPVVKILAPLALLVALGALAACDERTDLPYYGYVEGDYVRTASPLAGRLSALFVARGDQAGVDAPLFVLEQEFEVAARRQAAERLAQAEAQLADLRKGARPQEIDVITAQLHQAESALQLSKVRLARQQALVKDNVASRDALDSAQTTYQRDLARVAELRAQLAVSKLAGRDDRITAAEKDVAAQRAALDQADWNLAQKSVKATRAGLVTDTLYVAGEWVPAGSPIVALLPPENIKLRFFVPQPDLGRIAVGDTVSVACDGCAAPLAARISFIAPQAEYTPPVIYSSESRAKLVYLIEARTAVEDGLKLHPGQPVEVRWSGRATQSAVTPAGTK